MDEHGDTPEFAPCRSEYVSSGYHVNGVNKLIFYGKT